jgi:hypothetical protein
MTKGSHSSLDGPARSDGPPDDERARGAKVLAFAHRPREGGAALLGVAEYLDRFRGLKSDLEIYYAEQPRGDEGPGSHRFQILVWLRQLSDRIIGLEGLALVLPDAPVMAGLSRGEQDALAVVARVLDRWIEEDEPFDDVRRTVALILSAADCVALNAARCGRP